MSPNAQAALAMLTTKRWNTVNDVALEIGRSETVVRRALDELLDGGFIHRREGKKPTGAKMFVYQKSSHRAVNLSGPLYESSRLDARPLARAFGNYTFTTGNNHGVGQ